MDLEGVGRGVNDQNTWYKILKELIFLIKKIYQGWRDGSALKG